jgi:hypothetical protein
MDEIDKAKIGKKDEKLVGWDYIRKPKMNTNYPPMRAKGAKEKYRLASFRPNKNHSYWLWFVMIIGVIIIAKLLGFW